MPESWYANGLHFECTRCGNCCTGAPGYVWVDEEEMKAIAAFRGEPYETVFGSATRPFDGERSLREKANGDCIYFDREQGCTIYPVRPKQCRTWPFWDSNLRVEKDWRRTQQTCPGAGKGELIPVEEITRRIQVIRI